MKNYYDNDFVEEAVKKADKFFGFLKTLLSICIVAFFALLMIAFTIAAFGKPNVDPTTSAILCFITIAASCFIVFKINE